MSVEEFSHKKTALQVVELGIKKAHTPFSKTVILGMLGGMFIAMGYMAALMIMAGADGMMFHGGMVRFLGALVFPVGIILTVLAGGDIFTGNALVTLSTIAKKTTIDELLNNWLAVLIGNFIGCVLTAFLVSHSGALDSETIKYTIHTAAHKAELGSLELVVSAFFCNIFVALAVWLSYSTHDVVSKIFALYFPILLFVTSGYQHSVANMFIFALAGYLDGGISFGESAHAIIMSIIGNALSGGILIPIVYYHLLLKDYYEDLKREQIRKKDM
ncbi:MAG: formate/nitrite transporter family protein [Alphaproteobacteria bacterium]|jgi:formate/nitrite transporter|nr:formate/nitrite transporter family protein [Alphaproteobacteria bacterium]